MTSPPDSAGRLTVSDGDHSPCDESFSLRQDDWGRLVMVDARGREHVDVEPVRAFPISDPEHWISICDRQGRELACVSDLTKLAPKVRESLAAELARREFVPVVRKILSVSMNDPAEWTLETDRGETSVLLHSNEDVRRVGPSSALLIDRNGIRYWIPETKALDLSSRRLLERYL